jgi:hypothetical protein
MGGSDKAEETEYEKELAKVYGEQWDYYEANIINVENKVINEAKTSNDESTYQGISDDTNLGYQKSFSQTGKQTLNNMAASNIDPSSGKAKQAVSSLADMEASVKADATTRSEIAGQERSINKMSNVMAMGQGEAQSAVSSLNDIAVSSQRKASIDASIAAKDKANIHSAVGAVAGGYASHTMGAANEASKVASDSANYLDSNGGWLGP